MSVKPKSRRLGTPASFSSWGRMEDHFFPVLPWGSQFCRHASTRFFALLCGIGNAGEKSTCSECADEARRERPDRRHRQRLVCPLCPRGAAPARAAAGLTERRTLCDSPEREGTNLGVLSTVFMILPGSVCLARIGHEPRAAIGWHEAGWSALQRRIVAAVIVSSEAWRCSGGAYKIRGASLSGKEGSGSECALRRRPPCLRRRLVLQSLKPGLLGSRTLRRSEQVRRRSESRGTTGWLPGGTTISTISLRRLAPNAS